MKKIIISLSVIALIGAGCVGSNVSETNSDFTSPAGLGGGTTPPAQQENTGIDIGEALSTIGNITYTNTSGYSFTYDEDLFVWTGDENGSGTLDPATEEDTFVVITHENEGIVDTEIAMIWIGIFETNQTPIEWAQENVPYYPGSYEIRDRVIFSGFGATDIRGNGSISSGYRTLIVDRGDSLLVVKQDVEDDAFNDVVAGLTIE